MKYKATEKFKELGIENSYHQLDDQDFHALERGEIVDIKLDSNNQYLIDDDYIEKAGESNEIKKHAKEDRKSDNKQAKSI